MSAFSERLGDLLEKNGWSKTELARRCGTTPGNVSRWHRTNALPDKEALGRLISEVDEKAAGGLLAAWVSDSLPPAAGNFIRIEARHGSSSVAESPGDDWPPELSARTRRKFCDFARLAMSYPDVMKIVDVLHAAAMRLGGRK